MSTTNVALKIINKVDVIYFWVESTRYLQKTPRQKSSKPQQD